MTVEHQPQRIARLTPVNDVLAQIDALVRPVAPSRVELSAAVDHVLAESVVSVGGLPPAPIALRDGYAVSSEMTIDAGSYAPARLAAPPPRVDVGDLMPPGRDAVAPLDSVVVRDGRYEAIAPVTAGEGVLPAGADLKPGTLLRSAGDRLRSVDVAVLAACGIDRVMIRQPRVGLVVPRKGKDLILVAARDFITRAIAAEGAWSLSDNLAGAPPNADAVVVIGGTGAGQRDTAVTALGRMGLIKVHGIAISPGETAALGLVRERPVLLLPGRLDAALAVWLVIGRVILARLAGRVRETPTRKATLSRKVVSTLGLTEVVPVRYRGGKARPIASGYWPLREIARSDGWILVPADSEGYPDGAEVVIRPWP